MDGLVDIIVAIVIIGICFMEYKRRAKIIKKDEIY
jgi:hypothetical protein